MSAEEFMTRLGAWEGYRVGSIRRVAGAGGARAQVWIELEGCPEREKRCAGCGRVVDAIHDREERRVRDLPLFEAETWLVIPRYRLACPSCGPKLEALPWLDRYARVTARLAESVARLCQVLPIKHVAAFFGLSWDTVKAIDKSALERQLGPIQLDGVELLLIDEFAIQRGHRYATVIVDAPTKRVLWVGRGRGRADIRPFFERLGPAGCRRIKAIGMDMNGAYELEVRAHCPQAEIVYDLFHVVAKYGREVIDRVRVDEANRLRHDKPARRIVKSARWLLLRNRENVTAPDDRVRLDELLRANRALMTVYVLRDDLKHLWDYRHRAAALRFWKGWYRRAIHSRIAPLVDFARRLKPYLAGILAHARWPLHTSLLEGINNKIKVIKRMAYGFRDDAYFFLKIRAAFPGIPR